MAVKDSVPKPLRGPVGLLSIFVGLLGVIVGYIYVMFGLMIYFELVNDLKGALGQTAALTVMGTGLAALFVGYLGWRGFNYFAY